MNLKNLFVSRDKNFARITEAGDYLGRRLRENLVIFDIDDSKSNVTYVTESNHLVSCDYKEVKGRFVLENFLVEDLDKITSDEAIDNRVEGEVQKFMESLVSDRYDKAEVNFDKIIEAFSMRAQIDSSRKKLNKRLDRFNEAYNIFETKSYRKFKEALPLLKKYFEENGDELSQNAKLVEGLRLSKVVGDTYDLPKLEINQLSEEFIVVPTNSKRTLYEMVCDKELVRKELLESKVSFSRMWHSNPHIASLASHIYSTDTVVKASLKEAIGGVPYLALASKVDLTSVMESTFHVSNAGITPQKDIREFINKIYEFKKPFKKLVLEVLNSKYGVNVQSLRFIPSFKGLAEVQAEVLDIIAESCDEGILCDVLKEFSTCMSRKGGVQVLDIATTLSEVMTEAKFQVVEINENFSMKNLSDYLSNNLGEAQYYGDDDTLSNTDGTQSDETPKKDSKDDDKDKKKKGEKDEKDDDDKDDDDEGDDKDKDDDSPDFLKKKGKDKPVKEAVEAVDKEEEVSEESEEESEEELDAAADEEQSSQIEELADNTEWRDLVSSLEDVTKKIDLKFDEEDTGDVEDQESIPPPDSPA